MAALDERRFHDWVDMLAPDIEYRMPVRVERMPRDGLGFDDQMDFFAENYSSLKTRVDRLDTDQAWSEQPISRARHVYSNVRVFETDESDAFSVVSSFIVARTHWDFAYDLFSGERQDLLRRVDNGFQLVRRLILLDQTHLKSYNLSIFF